MDMGWLAILPGGLLETQVSLGEMLLVTVKIPFIGPSLKKLQLIVFLLSV